MIIKPLLVLKKQLFLISVLYTLTLTFVCLMKLKELPDVGISNADKVFHSITYLILALLWYGSFIVKFKIPNVKALIYSALFSTIFGIIIEVLQGMVTVTRKPDLEDVIANSTGVLLAVLVALVYNRTQIKKL
ncbi:VanZ family protein [Aestuariibaculum sp. YM273]|uniref:VanZ family protein n=1 Tax=Aestuariibaculum sp. YM273 TaxID=3070659 RepID=UPI0027DE5A82|nr:VanZ family protein [Aestuariibaculum sp. YM273]WMI66961.1 VanZ family protein [Aestuariibaculum sp. YM273]